MTDSTAKTADERIAERDAATEVFREQLASMMFDGPHGITQGGPFGGMGLFGSGEIRYAICLKCGAMVRLDDPLERDGLPPVERSIRLHWEWHEELT